MLTFSDLLLTEFMLKCARATILELRLWRDFKLLFPSNPFITSKCATTSSIFQAMITLITSKRISNSPISEV